VVVESIPDFFPHGTGRGTFPAVLKILHPDKHTKKKRRRKK